MSQTSKPILIKGSTKLQYSLPVNSFKTAGGIKHLAPGWSKQSLGALKIKEEKQKKCHWPSSYACTHVARNYFICSHCSKQNIYGRVGDAKFWSGKGDIAAYLAGDTCVRVLYIWRGGGEWWWGMFAHTLRFRFSLEIFLCLFLSFSLSFSLSSFSASRTFLIEAAAWAILQRGAPAQSSRFPPHWDPGDLFISQGHRGGDAGRQKSTGQSSSPALPLSPSSSGTLW